MFLPKFLSHVIASYVYEADKLTRYAMVNGYTDHSERSYMGAIAGYSMGELIRHKILGRNVNMYFDVRDRRKHDGIIIFRIRDKVKIGICEAKILRFEQRITRRDNNLNTAWDWAERGTNNSHFYKQVQNFEKISSKIAKWYVFALDLGIDRRSPPLQSKASSCIWHQNMRHHIRASDISIHHIWTLDDLINVPSYMHNNLYEIIYDILQCKKGIPFRVPNGINTVQVKIRGADTWVVPVPSYIDGNEKIVNMQGLINEFMGKNGLGFYSYYDLTNLVE